MARQPRSQQMTLLGRLVTTDGNVLAGADLKISFRSTQNAGRTGEFTAVTDDDGAFQLRLPADQLANIDWPSAQVEISKEDVSYTIVRRSDLRQLDNGVWEATWIVQTATPAIPPGPVAPLPVVPPEPGVPASRKPKPHRVYGRVFRPDGHPATGLHVVAFDRQVCDETVLGTAETSKAGHYDIPYAPEMVWEEGKQAADLIVRVYADGQTTSEPLAVSPLILGAARQQQVNLSAGQERFRGLSLYERIAMGAKPHMAGKDFDCIEPQDVWLLADKTGLGPTAIAQFVKAQELVSLSKIDNGKTKAAMALFAISRANLVPDLPAFAMQPDSRLHAAVEAAIRRNWIPALNVQAVIASLRNARVAAFGQEDTSFQTVTRLAGLTKAQGATVRRLILADGALTEDGWAKLAKKAGLNDKAVFKLRSLSQASALVGGRADVLEAAHKKIKIKDSADLAALTLRDWKALVRPLARGLPPSIPGKDARERAANYATVVFRNLESTYPSTAFKARLTSDGYLGSPKIKTFLTRNPDFDFDTSSLQGRYEEADTPAKMERLTAMENLVSLYRVLPVDDRFDKLKLLHTAGLESPRAVAAMNRTAFRKTYATRLGGVPVADIVLKNARHAVARDLALRAKGYPEMNGGTVSYLSAATAAVPTPAGIPFPTLEALFGNPNTTFCNHCESALSPSAYLVDLLGFLDRATDDDGVTARELLRHRRPDIELLELDCDNAETVMPDIDLVLEVLENAVTAQPGNVFQTELTSAEIAARPEHTNVSAYDALKNTFYPWNLPFDLGIETCRAYLAQLGTPRHELLRDLHEATDATAARALADAEYLGLTPAMATAVAKPVTGKIQLGQLWGLGTGVSIDTVTNVETVVRKSRLDFETVEAILETSFVNPGGTVSLDANGELAGASPSFFDRFRRFAALHVNAGLAVEVLDDILASLSPAQANATSLVANVAAIVRLADKSGLEAAAITGFWRGDTTPVHAFAESLGADVADVERLAQLLGHEPESPRDALRFWMEWNKIAEMGLAVGDIAALLRTPEPEEAFSVEAASAALERIRTALTDAEAVAEQPDTPAGALSAAKRIEICLNGIGTETGTDQALVADMLLDADGAASHPVLVALTGEDFTAAETVDINLAHGFAKLWKQLSLCAWLQIQHADLPVISAGAPTMDWLDPAKLSSRLAAGHPTFRQLALLHAYQQINLDRFTLGTSLFEALRTLLSAGVTLGGFADAITDYCTWPETDVAFLTGAGGFGWSDRGDFLSSSGLLKLERAITLAEKAAVPAETIWTFTDAARSQEIRAALAEKHDDDKWLQVSGQIHDALRETQRDALLGYLLHLGQQLSPLIVDEYDVYAFFLIDPEMSACFDTSRIKQANGSVQQYIQRILLNLEGSLSFAPEDIEQWEWRKNYRVWEANCNVFIYPENWLEPELRDNKTALFTTLEDRLLQDEVREDTAEQALLDYCHGLHGIANLEIAALLDDPETDTLHVFSRTEALPHQYYFCVRDPNGVWGSWQEIKLDIQGNHLVPVAYNRQLYLFWLSFEEKLDTDSEDYQTELAEAELEIKTAQTDLDSNKKSIDDLKNKIDEYNGYGGSYDNFVPVLEDILDELEDDTETFEDNLVDAVQLKERVIASYTYQDVSLNWSSTRDANTWSTKKVSTKALSTKTESYGYFSDKEEIFCRIADDDDKLAIQAFADISSREEGFSDGLDLYVELGQFLLDVCNESLVTEPGVVHHSGDVFFLNAQHENQKLFLGSIYPTLYFVPGIDQLDLLLRNPHGKEKHCALPPTVSAPSQVSVFSYEDIDRCFIVDRTASLDLESLLDNRLDHTKELIAPSEDGSALAAPAGKSAYAHETVFEGTTRAASRATAYKRSAGVTARSKDTIPDEIVETKVTESLDIASLAAFEFVPGLFEKVLSSGEFTFTELYHPYTCTFIRQLSRLGIEGLYKPDPDGSDDDKDLYRQSAEQDYFFAAYTPDDRVSSDYPVERIELEYGRPYAVYNWELFFHAPMLIAKRLIQNQQFEEARRWLHFIFDPTATDGTETARYWRFRPFYEEQVRLSQGGYGSLGALVQSATAEFEAQVAAWEENPFNPHAIARLRTVAYMRNTVMTYLDNLIAWGDQLFRRDTMEAIGEAALLYVLAAEILGPRPLQLPGASSEATPPTAQDLLNGTALATLLGQGSAVPPSTATDISGFLGNLLLFCIPANDKLLAYWDTVADRLFKIRNCMNIDGIVRSLPLYEPPIDPALLVRATAAGVSVADAISGHSVARPHYRFTHTLRKAQEFCGEVKAFGGMLLSALEKQDTEALVRIRAGHDSAMAERVLEVRKEQVAEIEHALNALEESRKGAMHRSQHFKGLIDTGSLEEEKDEKKKLAAAQGWALSAQLINAIGSTLFVGIPQTAIGIAASVETGGLHFGHGTQATSRLMNALSSQLTFEAASLSRKAAAARRAQDWSLQHYMAERDLGRVQHDILATEIRKAVADREVDNQTTRIAQAEEAEAFLMDKFTGKELHGWMVTQLSGLYFQAYQLAYDMAKGAEQCYRYELGVDDAEFVGFGHWDSLREGLLAGERLGWDLRRLEASYLNQNKRGFELTKNVSLAQVNPAALMQLRETGSCQLVLPEDIFDLDYPGHYKRRIKSVSLSIPAVTGPYTNVSCTLTLLQDGVRKKADPALPEDDVSWNATPQSIATGGALDDAGLFQFDFRDDRYLPFEGAGVISQWTLELADPTIAQFDYHSISDVIMHIRYSAEYGGDAFKAEVTGRLQAAIDAFLTGLGDMPPAGDGAAAGMFQLLSVKQYFPDVWTHLAASDPTAAFEAALSLTKEHFPFFVRAREISLLELSLLAVPKQSTDDLGSDVLTGIELKKPGGAPETDLSVLDAKDSDYRVPTATFANLAQQGLGEWLYRLPAELVAAAPDLNDLYLVCRYRAGRTG